MAEPQPTVPALYVPDEPEETTSPQEPQEAAEQVEETPPQEEAAEEAAPEGEAEPQATGAEDEKETQPGHNRDKAVIQLQQRQTTFERQIGQQFESLGEQIKSLAAAIEKRGGEATPAQAQQVQEVKDDLQDLIGQLGDEDFVEGSKVKAIVTRLAQRAATPAKAPAELEEVKKTLSELTGRMRADEQQRAFRDDFTRANPQVADQLDALIAKAHERMAQMPTKLVGEAAQGAFTALFYGLVDEAKAAKQTKPKVAPAGKTPAKATAGTQTVAAGAATHKPATAPAKAKVPLWVPD